MRNKNQKNPFRCLELLQSSCAKCYALVFKSELSRQIHTTYHITSLLQTSKSKNTVLIIACYAGKLIKIYPNIHQNTMDNSESILYNFHSKSVNKTLTIAQRRMKLLLPYAYGRSSETCHSFGMC